MRGLEAVDVGIEIVVWALRDEVLASLHLVQHQQTLPISLLSLTCGVHLVIPNGGETEGTMPPLSFGSTPDVPILGLTYCNTPASWW